MCKQHHSIIFQHHLCLSSVLRNCSATSNNFFFFFLLKLLPNSIEVSFLVKIWNFSKTLHDSSWSLIKMVQMRINTLDKLSRKQSQRSCCLCRRVPLCLRWGCYCIYVRIDGSGAGESEHQLLLQRTRVRATAPTRQLTPSLTPIPGGILWSSDLPKHALRAEYVCTDTCRESTCIISLKVFVKRGKKVPPQFGSAETLLTMWPERRPPL